MLIKHLRVIAVLASLGCVMNAHAMARAEYNHAVEIANADYKAAKSKCKEFSGNAKDVCVKQVKADYTRATSDAKAQYKGTPHARAEAREDQSEANYKLEKEKCDDLSGNDKDACLLAAKANWRKAKTTK